MYSDGSEYNGEWLNDDKNGAGVFIYSNGEKYLGEFREGEKSGRGIYVVTQQLFLYILFLK